MYIYNVTCNVANEVHNEWILWMKTQHIPEVMASQCFIAYKILKLIHIEDEGSTYAIQYTYQNEMAIAKYQTEFAPKLQKKTQEKFGTSVLAFRTYMEIVSD